MDLDLAAAAALATLDDATRRGFVNDPLAALTGLGLAVEAVTHVDEARDGGGACGTPDAGQGRGVELYEALIERARASGARVLSSDSSVSDSAQRVWQSLIRRGHPITAREGVNGTTVYELRLTDAPTAGPSRPPPDTAKSYRPGPPKGGFFFSRRR